MKKAIGLLAFLLVLQACNNSDTTSQKPTAASENDIDAARNFIRAALDGKWSDARRYMLRDSINDQLIDMTENRYRDVSRDDQRSYRESSIRLDPSRQIGDSVTIVTYSNSFRNKKDSLRVVRKDDQWLVDLKYSLLSTDTSRHVH